MPVDLAQRHVPVDPKAKLGSGARFAKLKSKLASRGARNPGALAAYIGRRAYGRKRFAALGAKGRSSSHANPASPALEMAMTGTRLAISGPYDLVISRADDGSAVIRHRRGGFEIGRIRHGDDGAWTAEVDGKALQPHTRQRGALLELIGTHNRDSGTPQHRPASDPLQPRPVQTEQMAALGIPAVHAQLANTAQAAGAGDGPRVTGLSDGGTRIYKQLRKRGFPHERAQAFASRAQRRMGGGK